jgi:predicted dehydrogenase
VRRTDVYGTAGSASTEPLRIVVDDGHGLRDVTPEGLSDGRGAGSGNYVRLERFVECILGEATPLVLPEEALNIQRIIDALYRSAATGQAVEIKE